MIRCTMSANPTLFATPPPALRLFSGDDTQAGSPAPVDAGAITLRAAYAAWIEPRMVGRGRTHEAFRNALQHWEGWGNPPAGEVTDDLLLAFQTALAGTVGPATVNKVLRHLSQIFHVLGPRGHRNPGARGLLSQSPYVEPLAVDAPEKRTMPLEQFGELYLACRSARWPAAGGTGIPAAVWWRCLLVFEYTFGPRTRDLRARLRSDLVAGDADVTGRSRPGCTYLRFCPKKTRRKKPLPLFLPLNAMASLHLRHLPDDRELLFLSPRGVRMFYAEWKRIQAAAGIRRPYRLKDLRVTCNTRLNRVVRGAGAHVIGHGQRGSINLEYYEQSEDDIFEALMGLPYPELCALGPTQDVVRQLSLFEQAHAEGAGITDPHSG